VAEQAEQDGQKLKLQGLSQVKSHQ